MEASEVSCERLGCVHVGVGVAGRGVERIVVVLKDRASSWLITLPQKGEPSHSLWCFVLSLY